MSGRFLSMLLLLGTAHKCIAASLPSSQSLDTLHHSPALPSAGEHSTSNFVVYDDEDAFEGWLTQDTEIEQDDEEQVSFSLFDLAGNDVDDDLDRLEVDDDQVDSIGAEAITPITPIDQEDRNKLITFAKSKSSSVASLAEAEISHFNRLPYEMVEMILNNVDDPNVALVSRQFFVCLQSSAKFRALHAMNSLQETMLRRASRRLLNATNERMIFKNWNFDDFPTSELLLIERWCNLVKRLAISKNQVFQTFPLLAPLPFDLYGARIALRMRPNLLPLNQPEILASMQTANRKDVVFSVERVPSLENLDLNHYHFVQSKNVISSVDCIILLFRIDSFEVDVSQNWILFFPVEEELLEVRMILSVDLNSLRARMTFNMEHRGPAALSLLSRDSLMIDLAETHFSPNGIASQEIPDMTEDERLEMELDPRRDEDRFGWHLSEFKVVKEDEPYVSTVSTKLVIRP